ncbi:HU family DNA-binding protein [Escherichia coli]
MPGFGKFAVKDRPERQGRNPATGEAMTIAASKKVSFTAAKGLKDKL